MIFYDILRLLTPFNFSNPIVPLCSIDIREGDESTSGIMSHSRLDSLELV
jgi:hypothetical protein